jgi:hypothetical protein
LFGTNVITRGWITVAASFGIRGYPVSASYTYTTGSPGKPGHGKLGGGGGVRTQTYQLDTPPVRQFLGELRWQQKVFQNTDLVTQYLAWGRPSTKARVLPQQLKGAIEEGGVIGNFVSENEVFDDHYGYSGGAFLVQITQPFPLAFVLALRTQYQTKRYTVPAKDLADSIVIADSRTDHRSENQASLSKTFLVGQGKNLKLSTEFTLFRNRSNAPYYDFEKNVIQVGLEFSF